MDATLTDRHVRLVEEINEIVSELQTAPGDDSSEAVWARRLLFVTLKRRLNVLQSYLTDLEVR